MARQLMTWLLPPEYELDLEQALQDRTESTLEWIWEHPRFFRWKAQAQVSEHPNSPIFWIQGNPGSGKTVLAGSIISGLPVVDSTSSTDCPSETLYYFFNQTSHMRGTRNSHINAYRALAAQLYHRFNHLEKVHNVFAMGITKMTTKLTPASESELVEAISQCLPHLPNLFIVLDALDECENTEKLLNQVREWCNLSPLRVLLLSRPDLAALRRSIPEDSQMLLDRNFVNVDIATYLRPEIQNMCQKRLLPNHADVDSIVNHLVDRAEGMFLWARLMVNYLISEEAITRSQRLDMIMEPKIEGLDRLGDLYDRIASRIRSLTPLNRGIAQRALQWIAHTCLGSLELRDAIWPEGRELDEDETTTEQFDHVVIITCCGLVEKRQTGKFYYIHLTALQFAQLGSSSSGGPISIRGLIPRERDIKVAITLRLLSYLSDLPPKPLSGQLGKRVDKANLRNRWPLLPFACVSWIPVAIDACKISSDGPPSTGLDNMNNVAQAISDFCLQRLLIMVWIEASFVFESDFATSSFGQYAFKRWRAVARDVSDLTSTPLVMRGCLSDLEELCCDMDRLHGDFAGQLTANPSEIWGDITMFFQSRFLVSTKAGSVESLAPRLEREGPNGITQVVKPTFSVSMSSADATEFAVLSIFPPEYVCTCPPMNLEVQVALPFLLTSGEIQRI